MARNVDASVINMPSNYLLFSSGLVGYWTMDGKDINWATGVVSDKSGLGNDGIIVNMATSTAPAPGKIGQALRFNGAADYVNVSNTISGIQTVGFWVKVATSSQKIIDLNGTASIEVISGTITANSFTSPTIYVDGVVVSTIDTNWHYVTVTTGTGISGSAITIGKIGGSLNGILDDVRIYNRALSANEIQLLYNAGVAAKFNTSPTNQLTTGLVGYYTMDGKDINWRTGAVSDRAAIGYIPFVTNMNTSTSVAIGKIGQALRFNGVNSGVRFFSSSIATSTRAELTISAWINTNTVAVGAMSIIANANSGSVFNLALQINTTAAAVNITWGNTVILTSTALLTPNKWYHIVEVRQGVSGSWTALIYINGVLDSSASTATNPTGPGGSTSIGQTGNRASGFFSGLIDDVRIYNRALSASEIALLYNSGVTKFNVSPTNVLTSGLVGYWTMDGKDINWRTGAVSDRSGQGNDVIISGMDTSTSPAIGKIGQALRFNGVNNLLSTLDATSLKPSTNMALSLWVYLKVVPSEKAENEMLVVKLHSVSPFHSYQLFVRNPDNVLEFDWDNSTPTQFVTENNTALKAGVWYHIVYTKNGSAGSIYLNSINDTNFSNTHTGTIFNSDDIFSIGATSATLERVNGIIDDVRLYNRALSAREVNLLYRAGR